MLKKNFGGVGKKIFCLKNFWFFLNNRRFNHLNVKKDGFLFQIQIGDVKGSTMKKKILKKEVKEKFKKWIEYQWPLKIKTIFLKNDQLMTGCAILCNIMYFYLCKYCLGVLIINNNKEKNLDARSILTMRNFFFFFYILYFSICCCILLV